MSFLQENDLKNEIQGICVFHIDTVHIKRCSCCIRCGPDEERILDVVPREDGARNSG